MDYAFLSDVLLGLAACGYILATLAFALHLAKKGGSEKALRMARWLLASGALLHATNLIYVSIAQHLCPMKSIHFGLSVGALVSVIVYLSVRRALNIFGLGIFVAPMALVFLLASRFIEEDSVGLGLRNRLLPLHISANIVGDALFAIAAGAAVMYLFQERQLKAKRGATMVGRLPPIDSLDRAVHAFLIAGFLLATVGAATGTIWLAKVQDGTTTELLRTLLGYVTWTIFSAVLLLRASLGWRGRKSAYGTLIGFVFASFVVLLYLIGSGGAP